VSFEVHDVEVAVVPKPLDMTAPAAGPRSLNIAILAMGGEGGGVLADWIVDMAEHAGYFAQATSVPGVAQRTGATIYYVEIFPEIGGEQPVLALMPFPGEVDVVIASELMEAGRAIQRGLVTPERTVFIASRHRVYSMTEKTAMGDGRVDETTLLESCKSAAARFVCGDFARAAEDTGSVISAVMFGALAGTDRLAFPRAAFEEAVKRGGVGVESSLAAFEAGYRIATGGETMAAPEEQPATVIGSALLRLAARIERDFPAPAKAILLAGVKRLADYQDLAYAGEYLDRLMPVRALDQAPDWRLLNETARHLALWMSYEDTIRVADLKTRRQRFERVRGEVRLGSDQLLQINEFLHPRVEEIADTLPAGLGRWLLRTAWARGLVSRIAGKGRIVQTSSLRGYLLLYAIASLRRMRRSTLRFAEERARIEAWLGQIRETAPADRALAVEIAACQRLVKGYSDTHTRGMRNFQTMMAALPALRGKPDASGRLRGLRELALADETGVELESALRDML
jgi:indolepyruvate ferredoxin oxidoreductase beta subunit